MAKKKVLAIGIDPSFLDFSAMRQFTPEQFRQHIEAQVERVRATGYEVTLCLIDLGDTAEAVTAAMLKQHTFDGVLIGAGLRQPGERLLLFEKIVNLVHRLAPAASICFNSTPADTLEALQRWIKL
jgi:DNA-binding LacI/PurR family transcriptional regulator